MTPVIIHIIEADAIRPATFHRGVTLRTALAQAFAYVTSLASDAPEGEEDPLEGADFKAVRQQLHGTSPLVLTDEQLNMARTILGSARAAMSPREAKNERYALAARYGEELAEQLADEESRHICRTRA
ncbi:hypothetical protein ACFWXO_43315 [Kitasatospora sp. NPDC059088]|uniref:hypothetical protein n=1 Tax=Kitasatospora sp. NPDC059088 TaxID=3346722 RepID=UPI00368C873A